MLFTSIYYNLNFVDKKLLKPAAVDGHGWKTAELCLSSDPMGCHRISRMLNKEPRQHLNH